MIHTHYLQASNIASNGKTRHLLALHQTLQQWLLLHLSSHIGIFWLIFRYRRHSIPFVASLLGATERESLSLYLGESSMLESLLTPKSIAVIGASRSPGKVGHEIVANLIDSGFEGEIVPVNPSADDVLGLPCYPRPRRPTARRST